MTEKRAKLTTDGLKFCVNQNQNWILRCERACGLIDIVAKNCVEVFKP
ncbi:MAG: hypothetical protein NZ805_04840 [Armatimonadetes bacterium]|nr:hypothetical protein [Armatimonadota bacterium]MDW8027817.1 hypothetical protein [Armatimonadota bacterium]